MQIVLGKIVLAAGLAALLMSGCATTQEKASTADIDALCSVLDTNHDGKITKEEFMARTSDKKKGLEVFEKCDTGKKGYLTYEEINYNRIMLPPEIYMTPPPVLLPRR